MLIKAEIFAIFIFQLNICFFLSSIVYVSDDCNKQFVAVQSFDFSFCVNRKR